jgi:ribosomal protein S12 methylthiotransferase accessory factor
MSAIRDPADLDDLRRAHRFGALVQPHDGLVATVRPLALRLGEIEVEVVGASLGTLAKAFHHVGQDEQLSGAGTDLDLEPAWIRAVVEAAERYASVVYSERDFVVASARELGPDAIVLDALAR